MSHGPSLLGATVHYVRDTERGPASPPKSPPLATRKKGSADAIKVYTDTTLLLLEPMRGEIKRLEERVRIASDQLAVATALLRTHQIEWPQGNVPPPWG